ncbi:hypothetical protein BCV70DRAFT_226930 [Testicularia cyperi]|uniref:Pal1-domain-containing protein n=1 Tax=Testicularia cyperi TaxID=1882483 RepID=A0A317XQM8_9BASI|nr:hypothetical protein BCV70DRAFT_226930 [Testicularia cyperi]
MINYSNDLWQRAEFDHSYPATVHGWGTCNGTVTACSFARIPPCLLIALAFSMCRLLGSCLVSGSASRDAVLAALSDVVTVSPNPDQHPQRFDSRIDPDSSFSGAQPLSVSEPPSMVPVKSPFEDDSLPPPPPPAKSTNTSGNMASKFANAFRKQTAEDKAAKKRAKEQRMNDEINRTAAKTSRMDIIDRLDLSGINGASMFHHDSPYDACAPHMNKGKRAPVRAFDPNIDPMTGLPRLQPGQKQNGRRNLAPSGESSPGDEKSSIERPSISTNASHNNRRSVTAPLVPSLSKNAASSSTELPVDDEIDADRDAEAERVWRSRQGYHTQPSNIPDSRYDVSNPNADVWGVSAEPWQDFAQPKAPSRSTLSPYSAGLGDRSGTTSAASSVLDMEAIMTGQRKPSRNERDLAVGSASPFPEPNWDEKSPNSEGPKRSKSLIKRIRSMRENPNVPPPEDGVEMGNVRDRRRARAAQHRHSPSTPPMRLDSMNGSLSYDARAAADAAVGASQTPTTQEQDELVTPRQQGDDEPSYFGAGGDATSAARSPGEGGGLGRSGSIFNKFKRGGRSGKSAERQAAYA